MKLIPLFASALLAIAASAYSRDEYVIKKVQPSVIRTPIMQFTGDTRRTGQSQQWLEVEVSFESNIEITDELTFKYYVLLGGKCLTGEVTHMNILRGRDLASVMYVSPHTIAKMLENKPMTGVSIENAAVQILNKGQLVASKSYKEAGGDWWQRMQPIPVMYNKNETPFSSLYWDRYEEIKPPIK
jgi:hypothetical protein